MPIPCLLCGSDSSNECLCQDCVHTLPTLEHACPRCATPLEHTMICGQCLHHPPQQNSSFSLYLYQPPITRLIADLKYYDKLFLSRFFAGKMAKQLKDRPLPQLLIPIPLHPRRLRYRGYNQSLVLAKYLSALLTIPIGSDMLIRTRDTASQASLPYTQRKQNIQRAFKVNHNTLPSHVALIDDVLTTGHTADIAAKSLRQAGVDIIDLWTIARTIRHY
ncbi:MAG: ComF family protein [Gammaproteobacteria bacterium]|nr:ComF family protein [Gammaproteobacteria bacterium]MDH5592027.1 ComF family protein [Gammaproteobacteria bacterium]